MHNPSRLTFTDSMQPPSPGHRTAAAPEPVRLRSASNPAGYEAALIDDDGDDGLTLLTDRSLPLRSVYNVDRSKVGTHLEGVLFMVEQCRAGGRPGETRLGHFLSVLRRLRPDA